MIINHSLINIVDFLVEDEIVVNDVVAGDLREEDGSVPADMARSVLGSDSGLYFIFLKILPENKSKVLTKIAHYLPDRPPRPSAPAGRQGPSHRPPACWTPHRSPCRRPATSCGSEWCGRGCSGQSSSGSISPSLSACSLLSCSRSHTPLTSGPCCSSCRTPPRT